MLRGERTATGQDEIGRVFDHQKARTALRTALDAYLGRPSTLRELQMAQAVALGEGQYGEATYRNRGAPVENTWNWGASQHGKPPCGPGFVEITDTNPNLRSSDNPTGSYQTCLYTFPTQEEGAAHYVRVLLDRKDTRGQKPVLAMLPTGDADALSSAMYGTRYFMGRTGDPHKDVSVYATGIHYNAQIIAKALGEPLFSHRNPIGAGAGPVNVGAGVGLGAAVVVSAFLTMLSSAIGRRAK